MKIGIATLIVAYVLSQFYRAFLAVLTPVLKLDIGATPEDLANASGIWFLIFAVMQLPVGLALDKIGPRWTTAILFALGAGGGALVFAAASTPFHITLAMGLIGIGCSPVLMASFFIFARVYEARVFATLAAMVIGIGSLGNIAGSAPMAWAVEAFGWRMTMIGLAAITAAISLLVLVTVRDPARVETDEKGSVLDLLRMPALWLIFPLMFVNYAPAAGIRGLWAGPYLADVFALDAGGIGRATLIMALAMVIANFVYGPLDRIFGTRKWIVFVGNAAGALCLYTLAFMPMPPLWSVVTLFAAVGFFGSSFPVVVAHARSFFPPHLTGRGVTLINLFGIGGVGVFQFVTGRLFAGLESGAATAAAPYQALFLFFAVIVTIGVAIYAFSHDRTD